MVNVNTGSPIIKFDATKNAVRIDCEEMKERVATGLLTCQKHPLADLYIYNYTKKTNFDCLWNDYTRVSRGLITDSDGFIVARPFAKFFNLNERPETMLENLPDDIPLFFNKLDGCLGILYNLNGDLSVCTRGTFDNLESRWATKWIRKLGITPNDLLPGKTYLFEIIFRGCRQVVSYANKGLYLLAVIDTVSGTYSSPSKEATRLQIPFSKEFSFNSVNDAILFANKQNGKTFEGFVMIYPNGLMVKIKSSDYRVRHKILTQLYLSHIHELLQKDNSIRKTIQYAPKELRPIVRLVVRALKKNKRSFERETQRLLQKANDFYSRKEKAKYIMKENPKLQKLFFAMLDNRKEKTQTIAWDLVIPKENYHVKDLLEKDDLYTWLIRNIN